MSSLFVVDTAGDSNLLTKQNCGPSSAFFSGDVLGKKLKAPLPLAIETCNEEDSEDDGDYFGLPPPNVDLSCIIDEALAATRTLKTKSEIEMDNVKELVDSILEKEQKKKQQLRRNRVIDIDYSDIPTHTGASNVGTLVQSDVDKTMVKSVLVPGFEQQHGMPQITEKQRIARAKAERSKTKGSAWFNLPATELTEEVKNDLRVLQMRSVLDPKHFYKKNDRKIFPKYFQIGTVQHSPLDYYSERHTKRNKKTSLVDELLSDENFQKYNKRKYQEVVARKEMYARRKAMKKMKKLKKNKE